MALLYPFFNWIAYAKNNRTIPRMVKYVFIHILTSVKETKKNKKEQEENEEEEDEHGAELHQTINERRVMVLVLKLEVEIKVQSSIVLSNGNGYFETV